MVNTQVTLFTISGIRGLEYVPMDAMESNLAWCRVAWRCKMLTHQGLHAAESTVALPWLTEIVILVTCCRQAWIFPV